MSSGRVSPEYLLYLSIYIGVPESMPEITKIFERIIGIIFSSISYNICFGCSKEPSQQDGSFEYPQHMF